MQRWDLWQRKFEDKSHETIQSCLEELLERFIKLNPSSCRRANERRQRRGNLPGVTLKNQQGKRLPNALKVKDWMGILRYLEC